METTIKTNTRVEGAVSTEMVETYSNYHPSTRRTFEIGADDKVTLAEAIEAKKNIDPAGAWENWLPLATIKKIRKFAA